MYSSVILKSIFVYSQMKARNDFYFCSRNWKRPVDRGEDLWWFVDFGELESDQIRADDEQWSSGQYKMFVEKVATILHRTIFIGTLNIYHLVTRAFSGHN